MSEDPERLNGLAVYVVCAHCMCVLREPEDALNYHK